MASLSYQESLSYAVKLLSGRQRSKNHLMLLLRRKGCDDAAIKRIIDYLDQLHLINEQAYAERLVEELQARQPSGRRRVRALLKNRKVAGATVDALMQKLDAEKESERARELAERYEERWQTLPYIRRRKRIYDLLVRRGFDYEICREAIEHLS